MLQIVIYYKLFTIYIIICLLLFIISNTINLYQKYLISFYLIHKFPYSFYLSSFKCIRF